MLHQPQLITVTAIFLLTYGLIISEKDTPADGCQGRGYQRRYALCLLRD